MKSFGEDAHIYVAGPLYGSGHLDENIKAALRIGDVLMGHAKVIPFIPHLYMFWHFRQGKPREEWLKLDKAWLRKCDGMIRIAGESPGSMLEEQWASEWEIPVLDIAGVEVCNLPWQTQRFVDMFNDIDVWLGKEGWR